jgi:cytochrome c-type biogenesis protein CcmH
VSAIFWTVAALFCGVAILILFVPLWRHRRRGGRWSFAGVVAAVLIAPLALALYLNVSDWDPALAERMSQENALLDQLARHLQTNPDDLQGWQLLAASYMQVGRYDEGRAAYDRVWELTGQPDNELKLEYAEAQILADRSALTGAAGQLVEEVLAANPGNPKALWYGGLVALELGRDNDVRARWARLLELNPPAQVAQVVTTQLAALGAADAEGVERSTASIGPEIKLSVTLGAGLSLADLPPAAQLFIIAREAEGSPPLAVIRRPPSALPGEFSLSDANSMIQGRSLAAYEQITVVARVSHSGQPTAQPGDWQAEAVVRPGDPETVALVIDQVVQ